MTGAKKMMMTEGLSLSEKLINDALLTSSKDLRQMTHHLSKSGGKGIRTQLLLNSAMYLDGTVPYAAAKAAAAIELLHMATLVHDDVIDNAPIRRGIEALHMKFGRKEAVICGDYLLCLAMNMVSDLVYEDYLKYGVFLPSITKALSKICEGEYRQLAENKNINLPVYDYLQIISGKTAALFQISAYCGAIIGDCGENDIKSIARFGNYLGIMFQILDDCKDFELSQEQVKKPVKNDVAEGVVTLPLILALYKNKELKKLAEQVMLDSKDTALLIKGVIKTGSIDSAKNIVKRYRLKAENCIGRIENEIKRERLMNILEQVQKSV